MCGGGGGEFPKHSSTFPTKVGEDGFLRDAEVKPQDED